MRRRIIYFESKSGTWPKETKEIFGKELGKWGRISVDYGSERERDLENHCQEIGVRFNKHTTLLVTGKDIGSVPFFYLYVKDDRDYHVKQMRHLFKDGSSCWFDGDIYCEAGSIQISKIEIDPKRRKSLDFMQVPYFHWERMLIISRSLKEALDGENITGYRVVPCLIAGKEYSKEEQFLNFTNDRLEREATHYQLIVTASAKNPITKIGPANNGYTCPKCGTLYYKPMSITEISFLYFNPDDLSGTDFQSSAQLRFEGDDRIFREPAQSILVSGKLLKILLDKKMKGIGFGMQDPAIKYPVVEVLGQTFDEGLCEEMRSLRLNTGSVQ
jgi:hypothetical protein